MVPKGRLNREWFNDFEQCNDKLLKTLNRRLSKAKSKTVLGIFPKEETSYVFQLSRLNIGRKN